jgi:hypothetical protein
VIPRGISHQVASPSVVEIVGAPGVGKTTLVDAVLREGMKNRMPWLHVRHAFRINRGPWPVGSRLLERMASPIAARVEWMRRVLYRPPRREEIHPYLRASDESWQDFSRLCLEAAMARGEAESVNALLGLQSVTDAMLRRCWILGQSTFQGAWIFDDDPLLHKCFKLFRHEDDLEREIGAFMATVPGPSAIIHLTAPPLLIQSRLDLRTQAGKGLQRHFGRDADFIAKDILWASRVSEMAANVLDGRGIPVARINGELTISDQVKRVVEFVRTLREQQ